VKVVKWWPVALLAVAVLAFAVTAPHALLWFLGMYPVPAGTSPLYQFWSGFYIVLISLVTSNWLRKHNCHVERCWRTGRYPVADGTFMVCRRHHPEHMVRHGKISFEHLAHLHEHGNNPRG
jgi:hypothetical protein